MNWKERLRRGILRISIPNLMLYVVGGMALVFVLDLVLPVNLYGLLSLNMGAVARGQVWRLVTFVFLPPSSSILWILFSLYFYWLIGSALESQWGSARFTLFYLVGMLGNILAALVTGHATNTYLNMSLFLAFAVLYPDFEVRVFMILPVKMKWLALLNVALYLWSFITGTWSIRLTILMSLANVILFLGGDILNRIRHDAQYWKTRYRFRKAMKK